MDELLNPWTIYLCDRRSWGVDLRVGLGSRYGFYSCALWFGSPADWSTFCFARRSAHLPAALLDFLHSQVPLSTGLSPAMLTMRVLPMQQALPIRQNQ